MDELDRRLLNCLQESFPVSATPYADLAADLGTSEEDVLQRIARLKQKGLIRRCGAIFDSRRLGFYSTLCAMRVPAERVAEVAAMVNAEPGVTHNYLREHPYNVWFTLIAPSQQEVEETLASLQERTGIDDLLNLPAERLFKIRVNFPLEREERHAQRV